MNYTLDTIISVFNSGGITGMQENVLSPKRYILKYLENEHVRISDLESNSNDCLAQVA